MQITVEKTGQSQIIELNENDESFKCSIVGVLNDSFDGTYTVQFSPDKANWINHESMTAKNGNLMGNLYFPIPYIRLVTENGTRGSVTLHIFGSIK